MILPLYRRIKQKREELGISQDELARRLGYKHRSSIQKIEAGLTDLPQSKIREFADAMLTTPEWLMGWQEERDSTPINRTVLKTIPIVGSIAAGKPILAAENIETYIGIDSSIRADFCLRVRGDSMQPIIHDGDICFIRRQETAENGQIAAVLVDDSSTLKRFYKHEGNITLISENPRYSPMIFTKENCSTLSVIGLCVGILHTLEK